eukprot:115185_1
MLLKSLSSMLCIASISIMVNAPDPANHTRIANVPGRRLTRILPNLSTIITTISLVGIATYVYQLHECVCNHVVHESPYPDAYSDCKFIGGMMFPIARDGFCNTPLPNVLSMDYCDIPITKTYGNPHLGLTVAAVCRHPDIDISGPSSETGITLKGLRNPAFGLWTKWDWVTGIDLSGNQDITTLRGTRNQNINKLRLNNIGSFKKDAFVSMADELVNLEELQLRNCKGFENWETINFPSKLKILDVRENDLNVGTVRWLFEKGKKYGFKLLFSSNKVIMTEWLPDWDWIKRHAVVDEKWLDHYRKINLKTTISIAKWVDQKRIR